MQAGEPTKSKQDNKDKIRIRRGKPKEGGNKQTKGRVTAGGKTTLLHQGSRARDSKPKIKAPSTDNLAYLVIVSFASSWSCS